jgi:Coenzyme PQQ synthesis protein D (PqqD)
VGNEAGRTGRNETREEARRFRPSTEVVTKAVGGDVVLVHLRTNRIYTLNQTGARLWELLEQSHDLMRAREQMLLEFDVGEEQLRDEIRALVDEFLKTGLLERDAGS